ncbi:MAG: ABC transporter permease [Chloroflexaceae bacterium]|nr:ABC transporter permease [Chloroflexaceae bacterium]
MRRWDLSIPVLFKEFRVFMRGSRAALMLALYVGLATIAARLLTGAVVEQLDRGAPLLSAQIGQVLFMGLSLTLQTLTVFLSPAVTLNAISREYERGTFEMLLLTPVPPLQFVIGKLATGLAFLLLLQLAAAPVFGLVALFGGVTALDLARVAAVLFATMVTGCIFGLFCSALTRSTYGAALLCYALLITLIGGSLFAASVWSLINAMRAPPPAFVALNPLSAMGSALVTAQPPVVSLAGGLRPLALLIPLTRGVANLGDLSDAVPLYRATAVLYAGVSLLLLWATLHLALPRRRWRLTTVDAALALLLLGGLVLAYGFRGWWMAGLGFAPGGA